MQKPSCPSHPARMQIASEFRGNKLLPPQTSTSPLSLESSTPPQNQSTQRIPASGRTYRATDRETSNFPSNPLFVVPAPCRTKSRQTSSHRHPQATCRPALTSQPIRSPLRILRSSKQSISPSRRATSRISCRITRDWRWVVDVSLFGQPLMENWAASRGRTFRFHRNGAHWGSLSSSHSRFSYRTYHLRRFQVSRS